MAKPKIYIPAEMPYLGYMYIVYNRYGSELFGQFADLLEEIDFGLRDDIEIVEVPMKKYVKNESLYNLRLDRFIKKQFTSFYN